MMSPTSLLRFAATVAAAVALGHVVWSAAADYFQEFDDFSRMRVDYRIRLQAMLTAVKPVAARVVVLPSPVYLSGVEELGEDVRAVRDQLDETLAVCRAAGGVTCLDPSPFYATCDLYYNLTHLNQRGHQVLAEWLAANVAA